MKVDHSSHLLTWRQAKILSVESAIQFFNFIVSIFEVESSSTMFLASLFSLRWCRVSSSSNWAIFADRTLFSSDIWALTRSAAFACRWSLTTWVLRAFFAALKLSMICLLKLQEQLTLTAASAVFALTAVSTMILAATSALTLRAAFALALSAASALALALSEGFFVDEVLERMSEFSRDSFWLRRDDGMMASGVGGAKRMSALWKVWTASNLPVWFFYWFSNRALKVWECQECLNSIVNLGGGATIAMPRIRYLSAYAKTCPQSHERLKTWASRAPVSLQSSLVMAHLWRLWRQSKAPRGMAINICLPSTTSTTHIRLLFQSSILCKSQRSGLFRHTMSGGVMIRASSMY